MAGAPKFRELFLSATKGQTITLTVDDFPEPKEQAKLVSRVQTLRSYYKTKFGVLTGMVVSSGSIELTVLSPAGKGAVTTVVEAAPGVDPNKKPRKETAEPVPEPEPEPVYNDDARDFYRDLFMSAMRLLPGASAEKCHAEAQAGARLYMQRFG